ncbi:MAG: cusS [Phycisphaerales bacterium]|nr:cusS [Phycisphaerales bacterium]
MRSLQSRLLLGTAVATPTLFAIAGFILYLAVRAVLIGEFDGTLDTKARALASVTERKNGRLRLEWDEAQMPEFSTAKRPDYFEVWADRKPVARADSLRGGDLSFPAEITQKLSHQFITLPDGRAGRQVAFQYEPHRDEDESERDSAATAGAGSGAVLVVARETAGLDRVLTRLQWLLAAVCGAATISAIGVMAWVVRAGLRPVVGVAGRISRVGISSLSDRIAPQGVPAELMPIVDRLNELLARLEGAFAREKSFTADVAHELRTPLAGLETALEVCASRPREPSAYERVINSCLRTTRAMHAMVDTLLLLARADARQLTASRETVDVGKLLQECWNAHEPVASKRALRVEWDLAPTELATDRDKLRVVLSNLLENAVSYADVGGVVRIAVRGLAAGAQVTIRNTGSRVSAEEAAQVFERFWRGDAARTDAGKHAGLGLSLCQKIMEVLGGEIAVTSEKGGEFKVILVLPNLLPRSDQSSGASPARAAPEIEFATQDSK